MAEQKLAFDTIVDCSGNARALETAFDVTKKGATILVFGCAPLDSTAK